MQRVSLAAFAAVTLSSGIALAHPSISSGPAFADKGSQLITFGISHGCSGADTIKVKITIPSTITSVRALYSDFGRPALQRDPDDPEPKTNVRTITWTKTDTQLDADDGFYEITLRAKVGNVPFTKIQFNVEQTCKAAGNSGAVTVVNWDQPPSSTVGEPAPLLTVVPQRVAGWNKVTLTAAVAAGDLGTYFGDAQILWRGTEAFSPNANTRTMIEGTTGVTVLASDLAVGDEIWVKY